MPEKKLLRMSIPIILLAFGLRLYHLDFQSIWWDEGHSIEMASAPVSQIATLPGMDVHPPGYFVLLHQWMITAGRSQFALRYLSLVFSVLVVALLFRFAADLGKRLGRPGAFTAVPAVLGVLAAVSPLYVTYAQEVRMYAVLVFFTLLSTYGQWRILFRRSSLKESYLHRHRSLIYLWLVYVFATAISLYLHYFTIFLLAFQNLAWLLWVLWPTAIKGEHRRRFVLWISSQLAALILFLPQLPLALGQTSAYANPNLAAPGLAEFISRSWLSYTVGSTIGPQHSWLAGGVAIATLGLILIYLWRVRRSDKWLNLGLLAYFAAWLCLPLALYFLVLQVRPSFQPRYLIAVSPALFLLWGLGISALYPGPSPSPSKTDTASQPIRAVALVAILVIGIALGLGTWSYFTNTGTFKDDSAGVTAWLATETTGKDLVYVDVPHPFHYYADQIPAPTRYLFVDVHSAAQTLNTEARDRDRLYWVRWWGSDTDPRGIIPFMLDKVGKQAGEKDFRGYHVVWWDLPADAEFSLPDKLPSTDITFASLISMEGADFSPSARLGDAAWVTLHFKILNSADLDYRASVRLRDSTDNMLAPADKDILNDRHFRTSAWPLEDPYLNQGINVYTLPIPVDTPPGNYQLELVIYDAATLEALPVTAGPTLDGISAILGTIALTP